jgi:hypothetical protein
MTTTRPRGRTGRGTALLFFAVAVALYLPGITWGLPYASGPDRVLAWGSDEIGTLGPVAELYNVFILKGPDFNRQYPLFHYVVQAVLVGPYMLYELLTGGLTNPSPEYPFGLADPIGSLQMMTILSRIVSVLMAAGTVVAALYTGAALWGRRAGLLSGLCAMLMFQMFYYGRTSNVDMGALFWTAVGLMVFAQCIREGLTTGRAALLGTVTALGIATKDASFAGFLPIGLVVLTLRLLEGRSEGLSTRETWKPLWVGLLVSLVVYIPATGLPFFPDRFFTHLEYISGAAAAYVYPAGVRGTLGLLRETAGHLISSLGAPMAVASVAGLLLCVRRDRRGALLGLPALVIPLLTIVPISFVNIRYVLIPAHILAIFAGYGLNAAFASHNLRLRRVAPWLVVLIAGWSLVRGLELTYLMRNDGRVPASEHLRRWTRAGDTIGYWGGRRALPAMSADVAYEDSRALCSRAQWASDDAPEFLYVMPIQHFQTDHPWDLSDSIYEALLDGSLGYDLVYEGQTRGLSTRRPIPFVNPPVRIFARSDIRADRGVEPVFDRPQPLLADVERMLGVEARPPRGLIYNTNEPRISPPCELRGG